MSASRLIMTALMAAVVSISSSAQAPAQPRSGSPGAPGSPNAPSSPNAPLSPNAIDQGFTSQALVLELSLLLPQDVLQRGPAQPGPRKPPVGQAQAPRPNPIARDARFFLTRDQADRLVPILQGLRENPMPSPAKAKRIASEVDSILRADQKAEIKRVREAFAARRRPAAAGPDQRQGPDIRSMSDEQRREFLESLPAEQRQRLEERLRQAGPSARQSPLERRQRQLDLFLEALKEYARRIG
jgi:hypothetical protein